MNWDELAKASLDDIVAWADGQPWCRAMAACRQDAGWHAEGDVWTHTKMVCGELRRLDGWEKLSSVDRTKLIFTALFHDSAKPLVSQVDPETGRITSPKHAVKGEHLARGVLRDLGCDLDTREEIARLVRFHGRPCFLLEKDRPEHEVVSLSWAVNNRLLYLFALADTRGRSTDEMGRPEENLHLWKLACEEHDCFTQSYPFANYQARFVFFRAADEAKNLHYVPHEDFTCEVTLMAGLPGSGKDTWLARHRDDRPVVSLDDVRSELSVDPTDDQGEVVQLAQERCREHLRAKRSLAFNATNLVRQTRKKWIDLFADYGARIEIVWVEPSLDTVLKQNRQRMKPVPEKVIRKLAGKYEPPTWSEAHSVVYSSS